MGARRLETALYIVLIVLVLATPTMLRHALGTEIPLAVVKSTSMVPTLNVGDIVVIVGVDPSTIRPGDIIIYDKRVNTRIFSRAPLMPVEQMGYIIIHRVIEVYVDPSTGKVYFRTKGDNNFSADPWVVPEEGVLGRVLMLNVNGKLYLVKIPYIGYLSLYFHG